MPQQWLLLKLHRQRQRREAHRCGISNNTTIVLVLKIPRLSGWCAACGPLRLNAAKPSKIHYHKPSNIEKQEENSSCFKILFHKIIGVFHLPHVFAYMRLIYSCTYTLNVRSLYGSPN